ncbi:MAG: hypothetical protein ACTHLA_01665 [Asticcacaulis sp.]|uniref:hypothetical protein n=1 Tax=Asticcacaulis sp. TaxID=1872648 RepID=UPI003F7BB12F
MHDNHLNYSAAARLFGCSAEFIRLIALGERRASGEIGQRILQAMTSHEFPPSFDAPPSNVAEPSAALPPRAAGGSCAGASA